MRILKRPNTGMSSDDSISDLGLLTRPWNRVVRSGQNEAVFVMARRNYKVYADVSANGINYYRKITVLDTGAGPNFIHKKDVPIEGLDKIRYGKTYGMSDANGRPLDIIGTVSLNTQLGTTSTRVEYLVCSRLAASVILGCDFNDRHVEAILPRERLVRLDDGTTVPIVRKPAARPPDAPPLPAQQQYVPLRGRISTKLRVAKATSLEGYTKSWVPVQSLRRGLAVLQPAMRLLEKQQLCMSNGVAEIAPNVQFNVLISNNTPSAKKLQKGQVVGYVLPHPTSSALTTLSLEDMLLLETPNTPQITYPTRYEENTSDAAERKQRDSLQEIELDHLGEGMRARVRNLLSNFSSMWSGSLGHIAATSHTINIKPGAKPVFCQPYRAGPIARQVEEAEVKRMLAADVIEPANSEWSSPVVLVPKADGTQRFCVDYRRLNKITVRDSYPLPRMDECLDSLGDAQYFTTLDCNSGYWQIPVEHRDRDKTTFTCHAGTFRFKRMPFGLMNAPGTFQRALDIILAKQRWKNCLVYLDDVIIFSRDTEAHFNHVQEVLMALKCAGVSLHLQKCRFFANTVQYLGHQIRPNRLSVVAKNIDCIREAEVPRTKTELRSFLGSCNVYRRFVANFAGISSPLNELLRKEVPQVLPEYTEAQRMSFENLKKALTTPPILRLPRKGLPYSVDTDASDAQIGCVLLQTHEDGQRYPIGFWSRVMSSTERNYSTTEKECLAVVWAFQTLRQYLQGVRFTLHTDHQPLNWILNLTGSSGRLARWRLRISEFDFDVKYTKGRSHHLADTMSRLRSDMSTNTPIDDEPPCFLIGDDAAIDDGMFSEDYDPLTTICAVRGNPTTAPEATPVTMEELLLEQRDDPLCRDLREGLENGRVSSYFIDENGLLARRAGLDNATQTVVPASIRDRILYLSHYPAMAGHPGGRKMYYTLRQSYYWPSMAFDTYATVRACVTCAQNRAKLQKHSASMKLFPASAPLEFVSIDILGELPVTPRKNRYLLVISDRFSKLTKTVPLRGITATTVAQAFCTHWVFTYGPPVFLLSDNGAQFTSKFFQAVCKILGISNLFTTTYHPQCNGQVERFNRTILAALRHYIGDNQREWDLYSDPLTFAYNATVHRVTGIAPFKLVLSRSPRPLSLENFQTTAEFSDRSQFQSKFQTTLRALMDTARKNMSIAQDRYKRDFDKRLRRPIQKLVVGNYVFVRKEYGSGERRTKLSPIVDGPFQVASLDSNTVTVLRNGEEEKLSRDRVVQSPTPIAAREAAIRTQSENAHAGTQGDSDRSVSNQHNVVGEFVIERITDHGFDDDGTLLLRVKWLGYSDNDSTWEPAQHVAYNTVKRYCNRRHIDVPPYSLWRSHAPQH